MNSASQAALALERNQNTVSSHFVLKANPSGQVRQTKLPEWRPLLPLFKHLPEFIDKMPLAGSYTYSTEIWRPGL